MGICSALAAWRVTQKGIRRGPIARHRLYTASLVEQIKAPPRGFFHAHTFSLPFSVNSVDAVDDDGIVMGMKTMMVRADEVDVKWLREIARANDTTMAGAIKLVTAGWRESANAHRVKMAKNTALPVRK